MKIKRIICLCLCLCLLTAIGTSDVCMAATGTATGGSALTSRMQRLPGEPTYYDPDTGVYFLPANGNIEKWITDYKRLPGENLYYKVGANKKYFNPSIYSQYITSSSPSLTVNKASESTAGFTLYVGPGVDLGGGIGGSLSGGFALSYKKSTKQWTLSLWQSTTVSTVAGLDNQAGFKIGFLNGDQSTLNGWTVDGSTNIPIGDVTVSGSGKNISVALKIAPGPAAGVSGGVTYTTTAKLVTVNSFFN